jgi:uncharacterized membrane protein
MRKLIAWSLGIVLLASMIHVALLGLAPNLIMAKVMDKLTGDNALNQLHHSPRIDATHRVVVSPSPDLSYSICVYDLSNGPLQLQVPNPGQYVSVAIYGDNTDNFYVKNDKTMPKVGLNILLTTDALTVPELKPGQQLVTSPSAKGLILIRRIFGTTEEWQQADIQRRDASCTPA